MKRRIVLAAPLLVNRLLAVARGEVVLGGVLMLQPDSVIQRRVGTVEPFARFIQSLDAALKSHYDSQPGEVRRSGYVVVAVKPPRQSNDWFDFTPRLPPAEAGELAARLRRVTPMPVTGGPVVFALQLWIAGGVPPKEPTAMPDEWKAELDKAGGQPIEIGDLVLRVWRD